MVQVEISALDATTLIDGKLAISTTVNKELYLKIVQNLKKNHRCKNEHKHHD